MSISVFTYNTLFNNATDKIYPQIKTHNPDIVCLQEIMTTKENFEKVEKSGLRLADYANSFVKFGRFYGVATFYNPKKLRYVSSSVIYPGSNILEILFSLIQVILGYKKPKTFLRTDFKDRKTGRKLSVCNIHLYVVGSNALRVSHMKRVLKILWGVSPLIMAGDFNYFPYQRRRLETMMKKNGMNEATRNISQTIKFTRDGEFESFNFFQKLSLKLVGRLLNNLKIDYIFYRGLKLKKTERLNIRFSDHFPIISVFSI